ncbi:hypothetical protein [Streptosporangium saharense]|uniref:Uncharacterized protein n=1 Tax=Streptosporangium saharense TaxID=1706840 RepID=A0A7W7QK63_9ACTN|nr:hypothetical protein [Streptosporangium saharense]MBB4915066.1 hypothetical protein [Streptosporangium saharense]
MTTTERVHGRASTYNTGCRCEPCTTAVRERLRATRVRLRQRAVDHPELVPHGTSGAYHNWGCRCVVCKSAQSARQYRARRDTPATD